MILISDDDADLLFSDFVIWSCYLEEAQSQSQ